MLIHHFGKLLTQSQWDQLSSEEKTFKTLQGWEIIPEFQLPQINRLETFAAHFDNDSNNEPTDRKSELPENIIKEYEAVQIMDKLKGNGQDRNPI